jgi:hypothetical protein
MHRNAHECVWGKTTPLWGENYINPLAPAAEGSHRLSDPVPVWRDK